MQYFDIPKIKNLRFVRADTINNWRYVYSGEECIGMIVLYFIENKLYYDAEYQGKYGRIVVHGDESILRVFIKIKNEILRRQYENKI
jgi:hypothetical protein